MAQTAIILYTVRELDEPLDRIIDRIQEAGYDGVQVSTQVDTDPAQLRETLDQRGLEHAGRHLSIDALTDDRDTTIAELNVAESDHAVISYIDDEHFESTEAVERTATMLDDLAEKLDNQSIYLHYHNHAHEFVDLDDQTAYEYLIDLTDVVGFELDVDWAAAGGADPVSLLERIGSRGPLVHMKDMDVETRTPVELGEGDVDLAVCARSAHKQGAEWLIYEHDFPDDPVASLYHGAQFLADHR